MMKRKNVLVIGATGCVGSQLIDILSKDEAIDSVVCLTRRPVESRHLNVEMHVVNFMALEKYQDLFESITDVVCCIGTTMKQAKTREQFQIVDHYIPKVVARMAQSNDIQSYSLVSSLGANPNSRSFYLRVKGSVEHEIKKAGFPRLFIYRPSLLIGPRHEWRWGERIMGMLFRLFSGVIPKKYAPTYVASLATLMAKNLHQTNDGVHIIESSMIQ